MSLQQQNLGGSETMHLKEGVDGVDVQPQSKAVEAKRLWESPGLTTYEKVLAVLNANKAYYLDAETERQLDVTSRIGSGMTVRGNHDSGYTLSWCRDHNATKIITKRFVDAVGLDTYFDDTGAMVIVVPKNDRAEIRRAINDFRSKEVPLIEVSFFDEVLEKYPVLKGLDLPDEDIDSLNLIVKGNMLVDDFMDRVARERECFDIGRALMKVEKELESLLIKYDQRQPVLSVLVDEHDFMVIAKSRFERAIGPSSWLRSSLEFDTHRRHYIHRG